jgi:hypothetical protein
MSRPQKILADAAEYIKDKNLSENKIYYFSSFIPYFLNLDPYDPNMAQWGVPKVLKISGSVPDGSIIVWDAHFGPNEGRTPIKTLLQDNGLETVKIFRPKKTFTVLGGHKYEIYIFQKKPSKQKAFLSFNIDFENDNFSSKRSFKGYKSYHITTNEKFIKFVDIYTHKILLKPSTLTFSCMIFSNKKIPEKKFILVVSREGKNIPYYYKAFDVAKHLSPQQWSKFNIELKLGQSRAKDERMKIYLWNKESNDFWLDDVKVEIMPE